MKMAEAIEIGKECGCETPEECLDNVLIHWSSLLRYETAAAELTELEEDFYNNYNTKEDM